MGHDRARADFDTVGAKYRSTSSNLPVARDHDRVRADLEDEEHQASQCRLWKRQDNACRTGTLIHAGVKLSGNQSRHDAGLTRMESTLTNRSHGGSRLY